MPWIATVSLSRLQREQRCIWPFEQTEILLLWFDEQVYALENRCPHQGFRLENGRLDAAELSLSCALHQWRFRLSDGQCLHARSRVKVYDIRIEQGKVWIHWPAG